MPTPRLKRQMPCDSSAITSRGAPRRRFDAFGCQCPEFRSHPFDLLRGLPPAHRQEARSAGLVLQNPILRELAALDVCEDTAHPLLHAVVYQLRTCGVITVLGGV